MAKTMRAARWLMWLGIVGIGVSVVIAKVASRKTVAEQLATYGTSVDARLAPVFRASGIEYPPKQVGLVAFKRERVLEVYAGNSDGKYLFIKGYPILAASGTLGPKLREGDCQVPEGVYRIESLNPNSLYHLSLRLNYPNKFDLQQARIEGRANLGGDIMIHGGSGSIGCLAMGDEAAEDLFVLAARVGIRNISIILSPVDFRVRDLPDRLAPQPGWISVLYEDIRRALKQYPIRKDDERSRA
ncbi:MAG TPA: L,D-transpeptidase family protein [Verrucomicrobiae bacterium]|nr:L,D-transpeptidase family protein [Verrucomicrobiae bacterium]